MNEYRWTTNNVWDKISIGVAVVGYFAYLAFVLALLAGILRIFIGG